MVLKIVSLLILGLSFPVLYFAPPYFVPQYLPAMYFSSAADYDLFMLIVMGLPATLGGLLAGWQWRWKGILLISLYLVSVIVTARIEFWRSGFPSAFGVPPRDVLVMQFGMRGAPMVVLATLLGAAALTISVGLKKRLNVRTSRTG